MNLHEETERPEDERILKIQFLIVKMTGN
jgi:hypothetical protein